MMYLSSISAYVLLPARSANPSVFPWVSPDFPSDISQIIDVQRIFLELLKTLLLNNDV